MSNTTEKSRNLGIDILCCLGVMLLLGLSFFQSIGFAEMPVDSYMAALPLAARWFCLSGAMLLAACTGFVLSGRKLSAGYFKIFIRLIYVYLLCSGAAIAIRVFLLHEVFTLPALIQSFFDFTASDTGKFAGMYFGLLLAAPFLNAAFHGLQTRRARQAFLVIAALCSTLQPMLQFDGIYLIPEWCKGLFPIAAYIGGAYIKRYSKRKDMFSLIFFLLALCVAQTVVVLSVSMSKGIMYCPWLDSMASLPCLCIALCMVSIFRSKRDSVGSGHRFFGGAAGGALAALLLGDPLLQCFLPALEERFPDFSTRLWAGFGVVPILFILCAALGLLIQAPFLLIRRAVRSRGMTDMENEEEIDEEEETEEAYEAEEDESEEAEEIPEEYEAYEEEATEEGETEEDEITAEDVVAEVSEIPETEAVEAYEEEDEEDDDAYEEDITPVPETMTVDLPEHTHSVPSPQASENSSRHSITVPVSQPEMQVKLTQPPAEPPIGVHEVKLPKRPAPTAAPKPKNYTLDDILSEQGIPVKHMPESVDDLIAELTK